MENVHKKLKKLRKKADLTQYDFGKIISLSEPTYNKLEKGNRPLQLLESYTIDNFFKLPSYWLLNDDFDIPIFSKIVIERIEEIKKLNIKEAKKFIDEEISKSNNIEKIISKILQKFYNEKEFLNLKFTNHKYKNRVHFILIEILKNVNYNVNEEAKVSLFFEIKNFYKNEFFLDNVKLEILKLLENIDEEECRILLIHKQTTINQIAKKVNILDKKINEFKKIENLSIPFSFLKSPIIFK